LYNTKTLKAIDAEDVNKSSESKTPDKLSDVSVLFILDRCLSAFPSLGRKLVVSFGF
jgi:hypothetical protein